MARPAIQIDKQKFEELCRQHYSEVDIAKYFGVNADTINNWCKRTYADSEGNSLGFSDISQQKRLEGNSMLIKSALTLAKKNGAVMIFLLKNWCGMTDSVEVKADTSLMQSLLDVVSNKDSEKKE